MWNWVLPVLGFYAILGGIFFLEKRRIDRQLRREGVNPYRYYPDLTPEQLEYLKSFDTPKDGGKPA